MGACRVITDADSVVGFRLAGVEAAAASGPEEAERLLRECLATRGIALILLNQGFLERFGEDTRRRLERLSVPIIIPLPLGAAGMGEGAAQDYLLNLIRRAIGYRMKITGA